MAIIAQIINPNGQAYIKFPADTANFPGMDLAGTSVSVKSTPKPSSIPDSANRLTFAVDVCLVNGFISTSTHIVVAARVMPTDMNVGYDHHGWVGTLFGYFYEQGRIGIEQRVKPVGLSAHAEVASLTDASAAAFAEYQWYRFVIDSAFNGSSYINRSRAYVVADELTNTLGSKIYDSGEFYIQPPAAGDLSTAQGVGIAVVQMGSAHNDKVIAGRIAAYWSGVNEVVVSP